MITNYNQPTGTRILKMSLELIFQLSGPELDRERPKDVEDMFNKVRDFYLNPDTSFLPE